MVNDKYTLVIARVYFYGKQSFIYKRKNREIKKPV